MKDWIEEHPELTAAIVGMLLAAFILLAPKFEMRIFGRTEIHVDSRETAKENK